MYGVVEIKGHQYKVKPGDLIDVDKMDEQEIGKIVEFDQVYFIGGEKPQVGLPVVKGAKVMAKVLRNQKDKKILILKRRPGAWEKRRGHRTQFTALLITEVNDGNGKVVTIDKESKIAKKHLK